MPYIKDNIDRYLLNLLAMGFLRRGHFTGRLNYFLFKLMKLYNETEGESYAQYERFIGELELAKAEIQRRMVAPYEDRKIQENGDVE